MIKNLIFDVGGVLVGYRWREMFREYGLSEEQMMGLGDKIFDDPSWTQRDMGLLSAEESLARLKELYPENAEAIEWFLRHGEQMVVHCPEVWDKIAGLKKLGYRIYILSNYSEELFEIHTRGTSVMKLLDGSVVSYQVHVVKPDEKIYKILMEKYDLKAQECLFFDDRQENVEAAERLGMEGIHVKSRKMLNERLEEMLHENLCVVREP